MPQFITSGAWRECAPEGGVIVPVPLPTPGKPDAMRWPAAANAAFGIPEGFFIGPYAAGGRASIGTAPRPTSPVLARVAGTGLVPTIGSTHREQAGRDLAYWRAGCVVLDPQQRHQEPLRATLDQLLGPGERIAGSWVWGGSGWGFPR